MLSISDVLRRIGLPMTATCFENGKLNHEVFCQLIEESGGVVAAIHNVVKINHLVGSPMFAEKFIKFCEVTE